LKNFKQPSLILILNNLNINFIKFRSRLIKYNEMLAATTKLLKAGDQKPTELESQIAQNLLDLEATSDLKTQLRELYITGAREIDVAGGKKAVILFVPVPQLQKFQKIQSKLVKELEKKFNGKHFVVVAQVK
jgi:small subunit ribosomal protein S7e